MSGSVRPASHAGSWYKSNPAQLAAELQHNLDQVPSSLDGSGLPVPGARVIIAPHAGYDYSGPCAAWAYKCLDLSKAKRVFVLGPSHTYYLKGCAVTKCSEYKTPFGDLVVDRDLVLEIKAKGHLDDIPLRSDVSEHSLEMHLPYLYKRLEQTFDTPDDFPTIVPILVGDNNAAEEKAVGRLLAPYLEDETNAFIVSSDFCHWGSRFDYTVYSPTADGSKLERISSRRRVQGRPIHETIKVIDQMAIDSIASGRHDAFVDNLKLTRNTVCGRHPIGVVMAALEGLAQKAGENHNDDNYRFKFVQYERSSLVEDADDSSVSYASAYAVL